MTQAISFFDVDHTLTRHSTGFHFALEAGRRGLFRSWHFASIPINFIAYRFGYISFESLPKDFPALRGLSQSLIDEISAAAFEKRTRFDIYSEARDLVFSLREQGSRIVLATAGLDFIVKPLAGYLGVEEIIASSLEFENGITTGRFSGDPVFGKAKGDAARKTAEKHGTNLSECAFYSDSFHDLPLLLEVGNPVVINPDRRLKLKAASMGWETHKFKGCL